MLAKCIKDRDTKMPRSSSKVYFQNVQVVVQELDEAQDLVTVTKTYFQEINEDNIHYKRFI
jgi:hypothetical protein